MYENHAFDYQSCLSNDTGLNTFFVEPRYLQSLGYMSLYNDRRGGDHILYRARKMHKSERLQSLKIDYYCCYVSNSYYHMSIELRNNGPYPEILSIQRKECAQNETLRSLVAARVEACLQGQVPRGSTDVDRLGRIGDDPVLARNVPVGDVAAGDVGVEGSTLARLDGEAVEATEDDLGIICISEADVQLDDLVACYTAVVGDGGLDGVQDIPELWVASGCATSSDACLWRAIGRTLRPCVVQAILGVL